MSRPPCPHVRFPIPAEAAQQAQADALPRWCVRIFPAVGGRSVYVTGFAGSGPPFMSIVAEPCDVSDAEAFVNWKLVQRMGAAESRPTPTVLPFR